MMDGISFAMENYYEIFRVTNNVFLGYNKYFEKIFVFFGKSTQ